MSESGKYNAPVVWSEAMKDAIAPLRAKGLSVMAIADKLGVDVETFRLYRRKNDVRLAPIKKSYTLDTRRQPRGKQGDAR
jgi:hypothetical protein